MEIGAGLVTKTVDLIAEGNVKTLPQESSEELRPAPKIFKETCRLDFSKKAEQLHNLVRGLSPYPAAWVEIENESGERRNLKVYETEAEVASHQEKPGTIISDGKKTLKVACADGYLKLKSVQLSGKRRMTAQEMLCGMKIEAEKIVL